VGPFPRPEWGGVRGGAVRAREWGLAKIYNYFIVIL